MSDIAGTERAALAAPAGKPRRRLWESRWLGVAFIVALLVLWEIAAATGAISQRLARRLASGLLSGRSRRGRG